MIETILSLLAVIMAIVLHEIAHGYAALALGDDTARRLGRLTLNPIAHVDRVGTLIVPGVLLIAQSFFGGHFLFGWAKPVPVNPWNFRNPRRGMMLVAAAGPATNFALAWLGALTLHVDGVAGSVVLGHVVQQFIVANLVLGLFNLLPIPPLDGGRIVVGLLPESLALAWSRLERAGLPIVLALIFLVPMVAREFGYRFDPVMQLLDTALTWAIEQLPLPDGRDFDV